MMAMIPFGFDSTRSQMTLLSKYSTGSHYNYQHQRQLVTTSIHSKVSSGRSRTLWGRPSRGKQGRALPFSCYLQYNMTQSRQCYHLILTSATLIVTPLCRLLQYTTSELWWLSQLFCPVLCTTTVQSHKHTYTNNSYKWTMARWLRCSLCFT